jgi:hypothetical protein
VPRTRIKSGLLTRGLGTEHGTSEDTTSIV